MEQVIPERCRLAMKMLYSASLAINQNIDSFIMRCYMIVLSIFSSPNKNLSNPGFFLRKSKLEVASTYKSLVSSTSIANLWGLEFWVGLAYWEWVRSATFLFLKFFFSSVRVDSIFFGVLSFEEKVWNLSLFWISSSSWVWFSGTS